MSQWTSQLRWRLLPFSAHSWTILWPGKSWRMCSRWQGGLWMWRSRRTERGGRGVVLWCSLKNQQKPLLPFVSSWSCATVCACVGVKLWVCYLQVEWNCARCVCPWLLASSLPRTNAGWSANDCQNGKTLESESGTHLGLSALHSQSVAQIEIFTLPLPPYPQDSKAPYQPDPLQLRMSMGGGLGGSKKGLGSLTGGSGASASALGNVSPVMSRLHTHAHTWYGRVPKVEGLWHLWIIQIWMIIDSKQPILDEISLSFQY